jgi:hypothetical protein
MGILFWYFPYIVFSAACGLVLRPPKKEERHCRGPVPQRRLGKH